MADPYEVAYPVNFYSGGDTTKDAFGKHIQEIERIYGIINALNADKLSAAEFTDKLNKHINSTNPHPNLTLDFSKITGNLPFSRVTGNIDGSRITGTLSNAYIDSNRVSGLVDAIKTNAPKPDGTVNENGWAKFANGLMMIWGYQSFTVTGESYEDNFVTFPTAFPNKCFNVSLTIALNHDANWTDNVFIQLIYDSVARNGFKFMTQFADMVGIYSAPIRCYYIAIGN